MSIGDDIEIKRPGALQGSPPPSKLQAKEQARLALALNANTEGDILALLSTDNSEQIRLAVARNKKTPHHIVARLAKDKCEFVRAGLAADAETPLEILNQLTEDSDERVRGLAKQSRRTLAAKLKLNDAAPGRPEKNQPSWNTRWA